MGQKNSVSVSWTGGQAFDGETGSGFKIPQDGDRKKGASPMEVLLLAMAGCSSVDVVHILEKMRLTVTRCDCDVSGERAAADPKVYDTIHAHFRVAGEGLTDAKVKRAVALSAEKYCSASIMLGKTAEITHSFEIVD